MLKAYQHRGHQLLVLGALLVSACEDYKQEIFRVEAVSYAQLPGWQNENFHNFWSNYQRNCEKILKKIPDPIDHLPLEEKEWRAVCQKVVDFKEESSEKQREFIQKYFVPYRIVSYGKDEGLFTGYFQPILRARKTQTDRYAYAVYRKPDDLIIVEDLRVFYPHLKGIRIAGRDVGGHLIPYDTREDIHRGSLKGKGYEIAWVEDPIHLFFMHIQGSGILEFEDKSRLYLSYAATNGHAYQAVGQILTAQGEIPKEKMGMQSIVSWLKNNPRRQDEILNLNKSYVFFKRSPLQGVVGALETPLTPLRSLAVDRNYIPLGSLLWLDVEHPTQTQPRIQQLVVAQDVGGAIKGPIRGDLFWGEGDQAGALAGQMKSKGTYYLLLPRKS